MKIGIFGDLQLTDKNPGKRVDNYFQIQLGKIDQTLTIFEKNDCDCIVQPGDFFDSPNVSNRVKSMIISLLRSYFESGKVRFNKIYCCWGQHDITGHSKSTLPNSPLAVLEAAGVVKILDSEPVVVGRVGEDDGTRVCLYGAGFGEDISESYEDCYNVLVAHRMIGNRPLWPGQELVNPRNFLRKYSGYDICIFGDYHYRFVEEWNGRIAVNVGALVRKTVCEFDLEHKPAVGVLDTSNNNLEVFELTIEPIEKVFDLSSEIKSREKDNEIRKELLEVLVRRLKEGNTKLLNWRDILLDVMEERKVNGEVRKIIDWMLEEVRK